MTACAADSGKWKYFSLTIPEEGDYGCKCLGGKLKKVGNANFEKSTGGIDLASSQLVLKKAKKRAAGREACSTTAPPPSPGPTESPSPSPTPAPTTFYAAADRLFEVVAGQNVDASSMWGG